LFTATKTHIDSGGTEIKTLPKIGD